MTFGSIEILSESRFLTKHHLRTFACAGEYDTSTSAILSRVCEDCYQLYKEPNLDSLCS